MNAIDNDEEDDIRNCPPYRIHLIVEISCKRYSTMLERKMIKTGLHGEIQILNIIPVFQEMALSPPHHTDTSYLHFWADILDLRYIIYFRAREDK